MPSYAQKAPSGARVSARFWRSTWSFAAIALCANLNGHALAQRQLTENINTPSPIKILSDSRGTSRISNTANLLTTSLFITPRTASLFRSTLDSHLTGWRNLASATTSSLPQALVHRTRSQALVSARDSGFQLLIPPRQRGFWGSKAAWIIDQGIGDDGIKDLRHGVFIAKKLAMSGR